ncbi:SDR family oxidoreductase [Streptomyces sp. NPDC007264]|uniref:SDR family oxidoreductase n=1 Tax=Streptomyces sp. NPDC007264 TaxID=3364777 RepID=UPI0036D8CE0C
MILVTGATGTIGSDVVRRLAARGEKVRALTRDPAKAQVPEGVETAVGHHRDRVSVEAAMAGVRAAFLVGMFGPEDSGHDRDLVAAAKAAGVRRIVKLSSIATGDPAVGPFGTWHLPGERAAQDSGLDWTILRPSAFASNTLAWAEAVRSGEPVPNTMGDGGQGVVDPRDVSEVAVRSLLGSGHEGRTYTLTGPEVLSAADQAAVLAEVLGRPVATRDLSSAEAAERLRAMGLSDGFIAGADQSREFIARGGNAVVTGEVAEVLGREPRTYRQWVQDHRQAFERP